MLFSEPVHVGKPNMGPEAEMHQHLSEIYSSLWLSNSGPKVELFETEVARYLGVKHAITTCNGTVGLEIAIRALELANEVIVPSYTFIATAHSLSWQGINPIFVDIDPADHTISLDSIESAITERTTGIVATHLWGIPCDVTGLERLAEKHSLKLLFDAAHAFGNSYRGRRLGNFGDAEVFSFHATKFMNTFEGGAIVTNNDEIATRARLMRNFGFVHFDEVVHPGTNGKMTEICAAMGLVNLASIDVFVSANRENYEAYVSSFAASELVNLLDISQIENGNYQYIVVELDDEVAHLRDALVNELHAQNVRARRYFWPGCHNMAPYRTTNESLRVPLPNTAVVANRVVVLPTGTAVKPADCERIGTFITEWLAAATSNG